MDDEVYGENVRIIRNGNIVYHGSPHADVFHDVYQLCKEKGLAGTWDIRIHPPGSTADYAAVAPGFWLRANHRRADEDRRNRPYIHSGMRKRLALGINDGDEDDDGEDGEDGEDDESDNDGSCAANDGNRKREEGGSSGGGASKKAKY